MADNYTDPAIAAFLNRGMQPKLDKNAEKHYEMYKDGLLDLLKGKVKEALVKTILKETKLAGEGIIQGLENKKQAAVITNAFVPGMVDGAREAAGLKPKYGDANWGAQAQRVGIQNPSDLRNAYLAGKVVAKIKIEGFNNGEHVNFMNFMNKIGSPAKLEEKLLNQWASNAVQLGGKDGPLLQQVKEYLSGKDNNAAADVKKTGEVAAVKDNTVVQTIKPDGQVKPGEQKVTEQAKPKEKTQPNPLANKM